MKLTSLKLKGWSSAYPGVVDLPLGTLPPGLIAIVGGNGAGKTSLLEVAPASIYRQLPARGGMDPVDFATGKDSFLELGMAFDDGRVFQSRLNIDGPGRKTDALLEQLHADGTRVPLNNGQRSTFDKVVAALFPSFELFVNSVFAGQGRGDEFARTSGTKRKDLFAEFLGLQALLTKASNASDAADLWADARLRLTAGIETLERETAPAADEALTAWETKLEGQHRAATRELAERKAAIADLEARAALATDTSAAYAAAVQLRDRLARELADRKRDQEQLGRDRLQAEGHIRQQRSTIDTRLTQARVDIDKRLEGNAKIQQQADAIRAAVAALEAIDTELVRLRDEERAAQVAHETAQHDLQEAETAVRTFAVPAKDLVRAKSDSALLSTVPCGGAGDFAGCQFLVNATAAAQRIAELEAQVAGTAAAVTERDRHLEVEAASRGALNVIRHRIASVTATRSQHEPSAKYASALTEAETRIAELTTRRTEAEAEAERQRAELHTSEQDTLRALEARAVPIAAAIDRLSVEHAVAAQDAATAAAGNSQATELRLALTSERDGLEAAQRLLGEVANGLGEIGRRREHLVIQRARLAELMDRRRQVEDHLQRWTFLKKALGKGGLPDLEIDAAGPTISATTNALLVASYGPRFALELVTQIEKADGSGMKDAFTVRVLDSEASDGRGWRDISELSGGEKVVVQEAFMCAIALFVNERSPLPLRTLFRDETGAALDAENAVRYVQMLRKVLELGGFGHCYFISHNPAAAALADAQIQVGDGKATIVMPPFYEAAA